VTPGNHSDPSNIGVDFNKTFQSSSILDLGQKRMSSQLCDHKLPLALVRFVARFVSCAGAFQGRESCLTQLLIHNFFI
jgi:hypothetical protein